MSPTTQTMTSTTATTATTATAQAFTHTTATRRSMLRTRTANLTVETLVLAAALLVFSGIVLAAPQVALLLFGIPAAAVLGIATLTGVAHYLGR